jgi:hypothetical protein
VIRWSVRQRHWAADDETIRSWPADPWQAAWPVSDERDHFYNCPSCGQMVDMRDLRQVIWHEETKHKPLLLLLD